MASRTQIRAGSETSADDRGWMPRAPEPPCPRLPGLEADIATAAFAPRGANLTLHASGRATMTSEAFAALLGFLAH